MEGYVGRCVYVYIYIVHIYIYTHTLVYRGFIGIPHGLLGFRVQALAFLVFGTQFGFSEG